MKNRYKINIKVKDGSVCEFNPKDRKGRYSISFSSIEDLIQKLKNDKFIENFGFPNEAFIYVTAGNDESKEFLPNLKFSFYSHSSKDSFIKTCIAMGCVAVSQDKGLEIEKIISKYVKT